MPQVILALLRCVTPGDALKDTALAGAGFAPALIFARIEGAVLVTLILGILNVLVVAGFRGVELYLKYFRKVKAPDDSNSP